MSRKLKTVDINLPQTYFLASNDIYWNMPRAFYGISVMLKETYYAHLQIHDFILGYSTIGLHALTLKKMLKVSHISQLCLKPWFSSCLFKATLLNTKSALIG